MIAIHCDVMTVNYLPARWRMLLTVTTVGYTPHPALKNAVFVLLVVVGTTIGNLLLAAGTNHVPSLMSVSFPVFLGAAFFNSSLLAGTLLVAIAMIAQLYLYMWADLSYVLPVTATSYIMTVILSEFVLRENVSVSQWVGVSLISLGVLFVAPTPSDTKHPRSARR